MVQKIIVFIGISLLVGLIFGYVLREKKYYYLYPGKEKTEVTKENYENAKNTISSIHYTEVYSEKLVFNTEKAIIGGLGCLGICFIILPLINKKRKS